MDIPSSTSYNPTHICSPQPYSLTASNVQVVAGAISSSSQHCDLWATRGVQRQIVPREQYHRNKSKAGRNGQAASNFEPTSNGQESGWMFVRQHVTDDKTAHVQPPLGVIMSLVGKPQEWRENCEESRHVTYVPRTTIVLHGFQTQIAVWT
ncbi:hypothetical protein EK21DRAFT_89865 [Setomelanomma holmii]|uniref:Uncharacterized protein n=1 Tax=Setomelanomma holmii TaxID=210430 RepID=A0A9P4LJK1_9PLEO|nr:hypothetical protein EK21DRAFT_89865 [Setomelanomma holmii]